MGCVCSTAIPEEPPAITPGGEEDRISGLPDELLHAILVRLQSAAAAARTSVLSRRWRGVWAHMPELVLGGVAPGPPLGGIPAPPAAAGTASALLDSIDAAINSSAAPTLRSLDIDVIGCYRCDVPAKRISPWLRFASQRLVGKLRLRLIPNVDFRVVKEELALPILERATEIDIDLHLMREFFLRPPPTGSFSALTSLKIACTQMDGGELGHVVSSVQCPCLRKLFVFGVKLQPVRDISISSESLECLCYNARETGKLEVNGPMLKDISVSHAAEACIATPKLEKVEWQHVSYDPRRHQFTMAGRHIQSLSIMLSTSHSSTQLMKRFDTVSELTIYLSLGKGIAEYMNFLEEMDKLPICEALVVYLTGSHRGHDLAPMMLHLLRRSICIRKFKLLLDTPSEMLSCTMSDCPCLLPENYRLDDITFNSLEEIGISFFTGSAEHEEFMKLLLSRCNMMTLKRVDFAVPFSPVSLVIMEVVQRIRSICHPNSKVQFNVHTREERKP